jgi:hypothetical protein
MKIPVCSFQFQFKIIAKACKSQLVDYSLVLSTNLYLWKSIRRKAIGSDLEVFFLFFFYYFIIFYIELTILLE